MNTTEVQFEIYTKEHYDQIFKEIKDLPISLTPEEISKEIQSRINFTTLLCKIVSKNTLEGLELFRVRVPNPEKPFNENDISSYSYPPDPKYITTKGRANVEGQQVFYAALDGNTAFHEMAEFIKPGSNIVYLSKWGMKSPDSKVFMRSLFLDIPTEGEKNLSSTMAKGLEEGMNRILSDIPEEQRQNYIYGQKKYSDLFTWKGKEYYHLTSAIAYDTFVSAFKQGANIPILSYPSVAKNKKTVNFAIRKDFAENYVYLREVYKVLVTSLTDETVEFSILSKGVEENGLVKWAAPKREIKYDSTFISYTKQVKYARVLKKEELFTGCCAEHTITKEELYQKMGITEESIQDYINRIPVTMSFDKPMIFDCLLSIPVKFKLYLSSNISKKGRIKYIMIPVRCTYSYQEKN